MLDYDFIKKIIAIDLSRQKELDADLNAIQQIKFSGQLKKLNDDDNVESMFILTILEKRKENFLKEV